ncbi:hypothetical protein B5E43_03350 [Flavonifractor sp. An100]|nr:hypothetical protein B5E43_03350 [Flavonifractor sp. An100]
MALVFLWFCHLPRLLEPIFCSLVNLPCVFSKYTILQHWSADFKGLLLTTVDADKAAKLDSLQSQLLPYMQAAVIGNKMLERAEQQVSRDMSERAGTIYFQDTSVSVDNAVRAKNEVGGRWGIFLMQ